MKLKTLLNLLQKNELISQEQSDKIKQFMKERQKENFFRLLKWLSIIGGFCIIGGGLATLYNILKFDFIHKIWRFFVDNVFVVIVDFIIEWIISPISSLVRSWFGANAAFFYLGIFSLLLFFVLNRFARKKSKNKDVDKLNLSAEQKNILKTNYVLFIMSAVSLAACFYFFNRLLVEPGMYYHSVKKIFPLFNVLGAACFITLAYITTSAVYLLFGIFFVSLSVGMFTGYNYACYWIGVSRPIVQILMSVIILLIGYITSMKVQDNDSEEKNYRKEKFASIYNWTGLLMLFLALFIATFWGFNSNLESTNKYIFIELVTANVLLILTSIGSMFYGVKIESKLFFNFGLTFLIIEVYTLFLSRLWRNMPFGVSVLLFGIITVVTAHILKKLYIKKAINNIIPSSNNK